MMKSIFNHNVKRGFFSTRAYATTLALMLVCGVAMGQRNDQPASPHVTVGGNVFGGGNCANVTGSSTVLVDQNGAIIGTKSGSTLVPNTGDVYGGGALAKVNVTETIANNTTTYDQTAGKSTRVTMRKGTVYGNLYGGGLGERPAGEDQGTAADVYGPVTVTVNGGTVEGSVFGCNNLYGAPQDTVIVNVLKDGAEVNIHNVYGGGNLAAYTAPEATSTYPKLHNYPEVNIKHGAVGGSVFGGGYGATATVTGNPQVFIGDEVTEHTATVSGNVYGGGDEAAVTGYTLVTVRNAHSQVGVDVYGGGNQADVSGSDTVNIINGTIGQDVYGGGALANVGTNANDHTVVNVLGGTVTRDVYGGGLGRKGDASPTNPETREGAAPEVTPIAAAVNSVVTVNIGALTGALENDFAPSTSVEGSATIGGSVFGCNNANGTPKDDVTVNIYKTAHTVGVNTVSDNGYAIAQVFGGGNQAHYQPTATDKKATVHVWTCDNTIQYLYGGGNAADVGIDGEGQIKSATDVIIDGGRIQWVFGGGNGAGNDNPGANVYGNVGVSYHAGQITYLFGGSNEKGNITGLKTVSILNDGPCTDNQITELYGGSNLAPLSGDINLLMSCHPHADNCQIGTIFGGSRNANINGNVTLTIEGGLYNYAFGGNNIGGTISGNVTLNLYGGTINEAAFGGNKGGGSITGNITVNVEDHCACPLQVKDVFGAGDQAMYTAPTGEGTRAYNPMVNVKHLCTVNEVPHSITGNVYGGGNGDVTDETQTKGSVVGNPQVIIGDLTTGHETYRAAISGNVYGGGNAAKVTGSTTVLMQKANSTVGNDIYGGGNLANVSGSSVVDVMGGAVTQDVYGGGALANVGTSASDSTVVTVAGGTVRDVYGGGLGQTSPSIAALVNGKVKVKALGGTMTRVFGCNNLNGAPQSTVQVIVNDTTTAQSMAVTNVFGGGNQAAYTGVPDVDVINGTVSGSVYGGGNEAGVGGGDVAMTGGTVLTGLYGGCNTSGTVTGNINVSITGGTVGADGNGANVHGGGYGSATRTNGNVNLTINGATVEIWGAVYGGSALGNVNDASSDQTNVTLTSGTVHGDLYGGGLGDSGHAAAVNGAVQVTVYGGTVSGSVYGCNNVNGAPQSTVNVDIYGTDAPASGYALGHVFGGGNQANFAGTPEVKIHNCDNSIEYVYGGGNAANVKGTHVTVYGGNSIAHVFGGCFGANVTADGTDVKIYGGTIDTIYGGNNESGTIAGDIKVTVNKTADTDPNGSSTACDVHINEVYGGGNKAASSAGQITIGCTGTGNTEGIQYVYGGANRANVTGPINLKIEEGRVANVFGGNNNSGTITGDITVTIEKKASPCVWYVGNVFGGGNKATFSGTPDVNIVNGTVSGSVYGGGNEAGVGGGDVTMTGGTVLGGLYGGCNASGNVGGNIIVTVEDGTIGSTITGPDYTTSDVFGGGYGQNTSTSGNVEVNINGGTIYGDVYGGSALGNVNTQGGSNTTTVNINGGTLETTTTTGTTTNGQQYFIYHGGNVYGGGLGQKNGVNGATSDIAAMVYGVVTVNIGSATAWNGSYTTATAGSATIKGNVYGCNNTNGSPQQNVTVNVFSTAHPAGTGVNETGYALANVFGGGNQANFQVAGKTATVNIYGCDNTVERTFGGSNAAASNTVSTMIQGGHINEAYAGGNGEVSPANVNGNVTLAIHGGYIGQSFAGSNQQGVISGTSSVTLDSDGGCSETTIDEFFCGGNFADYYGDIDLPINCTEGMNLIRNLYGGCKQANVLKYPTAQEIIDNPGNFPASVVTLYNEHQSTWDTEYAGKGGNVHLTVKGGIYENVFGGSQGKIDPANAANNISADIAGHILLEIHGGTVTKAVYGGSHILGRVAGTITVNVEDKYTSDACPLDLSIADIYGGGNQADYTTPEVSGHTETHDFPQVNIKNATVKNVFGGGYAAEVEGNPQIRIKKGAKVLGNVYGGGNMGEVKDNTATTEVQEGNPRVIINGKDESANPTGNAVLYPGYTLPELPSEP